MENIKEVNQFRSTIGGKTEQRDLRPGKWFRGEIEKGVHYRQTDNNLQKREGLLKGAVGEELYAGVSGLINTMLDKKSSSKEILAEVNKRFKNLDPEWCIGIWSEVCAQRQVNGSKTAPGEKAEYGYIEDKKK